MDNLEHAYLLRNEQLLLLLSLLDDRPVTMFSLEMPDYPLSRWEQVAMGLQRAELLRCDPAGGLLIRPDLQALLTALKQAPRLWTLVQPGRTSALRTVYGDASSVLLETGGKGLRRLSALSVPLPDWCREEALLPDLLPEDALPEAVVPQGLPPFASQDTAWLTLPSLAAVVTCYDGDGTRRARWIWPDGFGVGTLVCQTARGTVAGPDTASARRSLFSLPEEVQTT